MKKSAYVFAGIAILILAGVFIALSGISKDGQKNESTGVQKIPADAEVKEFSIVAQRWSFIPSEIRVKEGDFVRLKIKSIDVLHGIAIPDYGISENLSPGKETVIEFLADKKGTFDFFCSAYCGAGHSGMTGKLVVE